MRCYNGCPDRELQELLDSREAVKAEARAEGFLLTWFPVEEKYGASTLDTCKPLGELKRTLWEALAEARKCS